MVFPQRGSLVLLWFTLLSSWNAAPTQAFDYSIDDGGSILLTDSATQISELRSLFRNELTQVSVTGIAWAANEDDETSASSNSTTLTWELLVDDTVVDTGDVSLADVGRELPTEFETGSFQATADATITVRLTLDGTTTEASSFFQTYRPGVSLIPLFLVLILSMTTHMVEISLFATIFVGACIISGSLIDGFKSTLDTYILNALADVGHGYVYLFTLFLAGLVGMMEKSGGMLGFTRDIAMFAKSSRTGQLCAFAVGIFVFFDDYANTLLVGETMRPLLDTLFVSREKLAFIVDATAAPIASISPISSWVGFEVGLIQAELDALMERGSDLGDIKDSGLAVFFESIKYRYYPIFMIVMMLSLILTKRDFGPMLLAERKTQVYKRTDGGAGKGRNSFGVSEDANKPEKGIPLISLNMILPILLLIFFTFYILVQSGDDGSGEQSFLEKIEGSDSYTALLWATMATVICTLLMYMVQIVENGKLSIPSPASIKEAFCSGPSEDGVDESKARPLLSIRESIESFIYGMRRVFPALVVLTLAWATGDIMKGVGADRLFARWITGGLDARLLPTLSFVISVLMALATGTSWGTMSILFPLVLVPTFDASGGDAGIFYAVVAGILSGSVAGDHASPISDTSVLSALACDCDLVSHVSTQAPYAVVVSLISIVLGTIPWGYSAWPNLVGILLGAAAIVLFALFFCVPVLSPTGRFDPLTEAKIKLTKSVALNQLREDTISAANGTLVVSQKTVGEASDVEEPLVEAPLKEPEKPVVEESNSEEFT